MQFYINLRRTEALSCWKLLPAQLPTEPWLWSLPRAGWEPPCSGHMAQTDGTSVGTALLGLQKPFSLVFILVCFLGFLPFSITFLSRISLPHRPPPKALSNLPATSRAEQPSGARGASNREHPAPKHRLRFDSLLTLQVRYKPPPAACLSIPHGLTELMDGGEDSTRRAAGHTRGATTPGRCSLSPSWSVCSPPGRPLTEL